MPLINVGYQNMVKSEKVVAVVSPDSAPIKRLIQEAKDDGYCIDVTVGRRTRSVIFTDSDHLILSALHPETIQERMNKKLDTTSDKEEALE